VASLTLVKSPEAWQPPVVFPLTAERTYIGRDPDAARDGAGLVLIAHHAVARKHAEIVRTGDGFTIRDLKSRSMTYVNSRAYDFDNPVPLRDGDRIKICDFVFVFHDDVPEPVVTPPEPETR
jgi:pSer/pThr/pTyr-binding forkhead associated (FHA) protein